MTPTTTWAWWKAHDNLRRFIDARCTRCNASEHITPSGRSRHAAEQEAHDWCRDHRCEVAA